MPRILFSFLLMSSCAFFHLNAQNFYQRDSIQVIEIFFSFSNWDAQLDANEATETYIYADSIRINGTSFDSCGVRYKGNSSYNPSNQKNPLRLELNTIKTNQDYQGFTDIKLSNGYKDPSMIREILSYQILENYMDCPRSNFARVYINGQYRGVYTNNESVKDDFNEAHYDADDTYFKCNPVGGAGPGAAERLAAAGSHAAPGEAPRGRGLDDDDGADGAALVVDDAGEGVVADNAAVIAGLGGVEHRGLRCAGGCLPRPHFIVTPRGTGNNFPRRKLCTPTETATTAAGSAFPRSRPP
jgi:hypothetical protein